MRTWAWMTGGLILWAAHFMGLYALASAADVVSTADDPAWRMGGLAFSVVCVALAAVLLLLALKRLSTRREAGGVFRDQLAAASAGLAGLAMVWQTLPTVLGY
ncbi:hypothetical protein [Brevundimonas sp.]|jgi:hypothetical protein|uniref:hypothetical protein n=1 Tax=Brevundimonas sp. TaxID=1871086 RepID=UPI0017916EFF|nr:hypothetical protein [Brevundimonas sp.]MBA4806703.1 hypothetical protein [Brevundimonas sp.]